MVKTFRQTFLIILILFSLIISTNIVFSSENPVVFSDDCKISKFNNQDITYCKVSSWEEIEFGGNFGGSCSIKVTDRLYFSFYADENFQMDIDFEKGTVDFSNTRSGDPAGMISLIENKHPINLSLTIPDNWGNHSPLPSSFIFGEEATEYFPMSSSTFEITSTTQSHIRRSTDSYRNRYTSGPGGDCEVIQTLPSSSIFTIKCDDPYSGGGPFGSSEGGGGLVSRFVIEYEYTVFASEWSAWKYAKEGGSNIREIGHICAHSQNIERGAEDGYEYQCISEGVLARRKQHTICTSPNVACSSGTKINSGWQLYKGQVEPSNMERMWTIGDNFKPNQNKYQCEVATCNAQWLPGAPDKAQNIGVITPSYCCGSDLNWDLGKIATNPAGEKFICTLDRSNKFKWLQLSPSARGDIVKLSSVDWMSSILNSRESIYLPEVFYNHSFNTFDVLATDSSWVACSERNINQIFNISTRQFYCFKQKDHDVEYYRFAECRGSSANVLNSYNREDTGSWYTYSANSRQGLVPLARFESDSFEVWPITSVNGLTSSLSPSSFEGSRSFKLSFLRYAENVQLKDKLFITAEKLPVRDISSFDYLEGFMRYDSVSSLSIAINNQIFDIEKYFVTSPKIGSYNLFRIPIDDINVLNNLSFVVDTSLFNFKDRGLYDFYVDNLLLINSSEKSYCGNINSQSENAQYNWISSRDESADACTAVGGTHTGSRCCGAEKNQFYTENNHVCWNSEHIPNNEKFLPVSFLINDLPVNVICIEGSNCEVVIPRIKSENNLTINSISSDFNISFKSNNKNSTGKSSDIIVISPKKYDFFHINSSLYFCNNYTPNTFGLNVINSYAATFDSGVCQIIGDNYCSNRFSWTRRITTESPILDDGSIGVVPPPENHTILSRLPLSFGANYLMAECCPENYCWDGERCRDNQANNPTLGSILNTASAGYRCIYGQLRESELKYNPLGFAGYCPDLSQCFVSDKGKYIDNNNIEGNPQCIDPGKYVGDHYCYEEGYWSSRTKLLADEMISKIVRGNNDYSLFCDDYSVVFGDPSLTFFGKSLHDFISGQGGCVVENFEFGRVPCMNNFCVLKTDGKIAFGTTLNLNLDTENIGIKHAFGINSMNRCKDKGTLTNCYSGLYDGKNILWYYDSDLKMLIGSELTLNVRDNLFSRIIGTIVDWFKGPMSEKFQLSYSDISSNLNLNFQEYDQRYDRLFFMKQGSLEIAAINGIIRDTNSGRTYPYVGVEYKNFKFDSNKLKQRDICDYSEMYLDSSPNSKVICSKEISSPYYVFITVPASSNIFVWRDLTSKLRVP